MLKAASVGLSIARQGMLACLRGWLRQFEVGKNSADINRLLDRLEILQQLELPSDLFDDVPPHRITRLRRQGERYFTDCLKDITSDSQ